MMLIMDMGGGSIVGSIDTKCWLKLSRALANANYARDLDY